MGIIFEISLAGGVMNEDALASIEYSVLHLGVKLVLVMGHGPKCGAVAAAVDLVDGGEYAGNLKALVTKIVPAVHEVTDMEGDRVINACHANAKLVAKQISNDPAIASSGAVVWPVYYDIETRKVTKLV
jgi:carbonic anhydrase